MRKIYSLLVLSVVLISCEENKTESIESLVSKGNLTELKAKKKEIATNLEQINKDLDAINSAISKKDTVKKRSLITTFTTKPEVFTHYLELQGDVKTKQNILVYPEMPGILKKIFVQWNYFMVQHLLLKM